MKDRSFLKAFLLVLLFSAAAVYEVCSQKESAAIPQSSGMENDQEAVSKHASKEEGYIGTADRKKKPYPMSEIQIPADGTESASGREDVPSSSDHSPGTSNADDVPYSNVSFPSDHTEDGGHWEYRDVLVSEAWDERITVRDGYYESVLIAEAWDEEVTYCAVFGSTMIEVEVCNSCGEQFQGGINEHLSQTGHSGWHNEYVAIDEPHCQSCDSYIIHHDVIYQEIWHDPEYEVVHHYAIYRKEKYWMND